MPTSPISSRTVYTGRIISVVVDRVKLPHGPEADIEVVRHPGSVVLVPMPAPGEVVLVRQYRYPLDREVWEFPAGSVDPGEDLEAAARRECHEEVGAWPARVRLLGSFYATPGYCDELMHFFALEGLEKPEHEAHQDPDEFVQPRTFTIEEARAMVKRGEIVDMKTALGLTLI